MIQTPPVWKKAFGDDEWAKIVKLAEDLHEKRAQRSKARQRETVDMFQLVETLTMHGSKRIKGEISFTRRKFVCHVGRRTRELSLKEKKVHTLNTLVFYVRMGNYYLHTCIVSSCSRAAVTGYSPFITSYS